MPDARIPSTSTALADGRPPSFRRVVSFHPRGGRLNDVQRRAYDAHAARWALEAAELTAAIVPEALFGRRAPLVVEIGSGMGESTVAMAAARPEVDVLALEVYKPGVAQTLHHVGRAGIQNVRLVRGDAVHVLADLLPEQSVAEAWMFFPDPWPKTRHVKRRLVTPAFAELVASRLRRGGDFRLATDWAPYAAQMLAACTEVETLRNTTTGFAPRPPFRPLTRFERRGLAEGREIFDLHFQRR